MKTLGNVSFIVIGVIIASMGEIQFVMTGFLYQVGGIVFEAVRLVMVQRILSSAEFKMDPLVSLYYYAPACAIMNGVILLFTELPNLAMSDIYRVGTFTLLANASVAFLLNVSVVFLVCLFRYHFSESTLTFSRSAKPPLLSSPFQACLKISYWSLRPCSSSAIPSLFSRLSATLLPSLA